MVLSLFYIKFLTLKPPNAWNFFFSDFREKINQLFQ